MAVLCGMSWAEYNLRAQLHHLLFVAVQTCRSFNFRRFGLSPFWPYSDVITPRSLRQGFDLDRFGYLWHGVSCHSWTGVGRRREFEEVYCTERTGQGNDFELIPTV